MKRLVREAEFTPVQLQEIGRLARALSLTETTVGVLYARGIVTEEGMRAFLHPSKAHYLPPLSLRGMAEAVELITRARDEDWRVAVFGDYDADGIGACAVLSRALSEFGIEPYLFVPERTDGYGMSIAAIDRIFDEFLPDLVITVDCGISNAREVEYIREQGAYCIVTDHHELPDELPDCIVIDPKLGGDYPYDNLCGAGVAFKLAQALIGERAYPLADFAALSTVADSVPLTGENRDIVAEGLSIIGSDPRPAFSALLGKAGEVTAQTLAFTVAPRINAAGRMGDANAALRLFTSEDEAEIAELAAKLNAYNAERQKYCDELYAQAVAQLAEGGAYGNVVMLAAENWNAGFVGIVAARIAEEYARPALLFVRRGDTLKGSARSIENVNIYEALKHCSSYIEEFGGHAQAAGVNVRAENFEALRAALDEYVGTHYAREDFVPTVCVAGEGAEDFRTVARELTLLEPCGVGNRRPLFTMEAGRVEAAPMKPLSPHLTVSAGGMDLVYFNGVSEAELLASDLKKTLVFEYNVSHFRGKEYIKGFLRCVLCDGMTGDVSLDAFPARLRSLAVPRAAEKMTLAETDVFLAERLHACAYGLCAVASERSSIARYQALAGMPVDVFRPSSGSVSNTVLYAPAFDCDLSAYREVVCLDSPAALPPTGRARVVACGEVDASAAFRSVSCKREDLLDVFSALRRADGAPVADEADAARKLGLPFPPEQVVFALVVFGELGLVAFEDGRLRVLRGKHTELARSAVYTAVLRLKEG